MEPNHPLPQPSKVKYDPVRKMYALQYNGKKSVKVGEVPVPIVTDNTDIIVKITATTVCGSDLHLYHGLVKGMEKGDIMGHECVGIIDDVGPEVKKFKKGDRVTVSAAISCGQCAYCKRGEWSCCETTNQRPHPDQTALYGHHTGALFGYSHMIGGYDGCQAEYVRVPFGDVNCFLIPDDITDTQALCIADIACTGYHGADLGGVEPGSKVVVFGCGPVGLMAQMWSKFRGAAIVVAIDVDPQRLQFAKDKLGVEIVNSKEEDPFEAVHRLIPESPDIVIDCVGFRFPEGLLDKIQLKIGLQMDAPNIVNAAIEMVRKNGRVTLIGDYIGFTNHYNIGAMMEKHLTINGGQLWPQKDHSMIFHAMQTKKADPTFVWTHTFPLSEGDKAYKMFDNHEDGMIKPILIPDWLHNGTDGKSKPISE